MYQWSDALEEEKNQFNTGAGLTQDQMDAFRELSVSLRAAAYPALSGHPEFDLFLKYLPRDEQIEIENLAEMGYVPAAQSNSSDKMSQARNLYLSFVLGWAERKISFSEFLKKRNEYALIVNEIYEKEGGNA